MKKGALFFIFVILEVILLTIIDATCHPSVKIKKRRIIGRTLEFEGKKVNEYLGIPYARPPVENLRFKKTKRLRKVPRRFEAVHMPPACFQYSKSPYPWYINEPPKSEDCLFLNVWTPVDADASNKKAVLFWIHGGGFRTGSIRDGLYKGVALVALGDIIVVTINYRLGSFGFLTTGTKEAPGNSGLWDILAALKWVNRNIGFFGGDVSKITVSGESAGSIATGYLSISPLAAGLFSQMIMESGSPAVLMQETKVSNLALTEHLAYKVGCANDSYNLVDHRQSVTKCLKDVKAEVLAKSESELAPRFPADFLPQYGDNLLPKNPRKAVFNGEFRCKKLLIGNNLDEGSVFISTAFPEIFGFFGEKNTQMNQTVGLEKIDKIIKDWLPDLQSTVNSPVPDDPLLGDISNVKPDIENRILDSLLQNAYSSSMHALYTFLGDLLFVCPDEYYAEKCAEIGGDVYFYNFVHRPSTTPWAEWMGVAHFEEVQFVFGKPLQESELYTVFERSLSRYMIQIWSNFVKTGKSSSSWPLYSKENPTFNYLDNSNSTENSVTGPHKQTCNLLRPVFSV